MCSTASCGGFAAIVGATGRVTGPHLHWTVTLSGASTPATASSSTTATASTPEPWRLNIGMEGGSKPGDVSVAIQIVILMTLLTLAPSERGQLAQGVELRLP